MNRWKITFIDGFIGTISAEIHEFAQIVDVAYFAQNDERVALKIELVVDAKECNTFDVTN